MARGGARNRSGPPVDPHSGRSDARGIVFTALPAAGFDGEVPVFPLPGASEREIELWGSVWASPQACAWSVQPWRHYVVGQYVRWAVKAEAEDAGASVVQAVMRFADQVGLTPAGLKENGWAIASDELAERAARKADAVEERKSSRDRMKVVGGGG